MLSAIEDLPLKSEKDFLSERHFSAELYEICRDHLDDIRKILSALVKWAAKQSDQAPRNRGKG